MLHINKIHFIGAKRITKYKEVNWNVKHTKGIRRQISLTTFSPTAIA